MITLKRLEELMDDMCKRVREENADCFPNESKRVEEAEEVLQNLNEAKRCNSALLEINKELIRKHDALIKEYRREMELEHQWKVTDNDLQEIYDGGYKK
jgi:hypothetical protein